MHQELINKLRQASDLHGEIVADLLKIQTTDASHAESLKTQAEAHREQAYFCFADAEGLANHA